MKQLKLEGHKLCYHLKELYKWQEGEDFYPLHLDVGPYSGCNHRCVHCYVNYRGHKAVSMGREMLLGLIENIGSIGVKSVFIAGCGEPLLNKNVPDAIVLAKKAGVDVGMATNGVLLSRDIAEKILPNMTWVRISILGGSRETYAKLHGTNENDWERLNENLGNLGRIKRENSLNVTLGAVFCVLSGNGHEIVKTTRMLKEIGFDYISIKPVSQNPKNKYDFPRKLHLKFMKELKEAEAVGGSDFYVQVRWDQFEEKIRRTYGKCYGLPFFAVIDADGSVYSCNGYWGNEDFKYGNLGEMSFKEIWDSRRRKEITKRVEEHLDFSKCEPICRLNSINKFLWDLKNPPEHVNFI